MKEQCMICGSIVEDVSGICPVCGAVLGRSTQIQTPNINGNGNPQPGYPNGQPMGNPQPGYLNGQPMENPQPGYAGGQPYSVQYEKKKKLFSILSLVCGILCLLTFCFPLVSALFAVASIVLGILALLKKHTKVMAILGIVFGGIGGVIALVMLFVNLSVYSVIGTDMKGFISQIIDSMGVTPHSVENQAVDLRLEGGEYEFCFTDEDTFIMMGTFGSFITSGTYEMNNLLDSDLESEEQSSISIVALSSGYNLKDITVVSLSPGAAIDRQGNYISDFDCEDNLIFVFPEDYSAGDDFYYIRETKSSEYGYALLPVEDSPDMEDMLMLYQNLLQ